MIKHKIKYFDNKKQKIIDKVFLGKHSFFEAKKWGRENLENFNVDFIQKV